MMQGLDKNWTNAGNRRLAEYRDLKPGEYTFKVIGSNNDGLWNEEGHEIEIVIHPPWWETNLAYTSYILILILSVVSFVRYRLGALKREKDNPFTFSLTSYFIIKNIL